MNNKLTKLALNECRAILCTPSNAKSSALVKVIEAEIMNLGFKFSSEARKVLSTQSSTYLANFRQELISNLKEMVGGRVRFQPLFLNFPGDVPVDGIYLMHRILGFLDNLNYETSEEDTVLSCGHAISPALFDLSSFGACPICQRQTEETKLNKVSRKKLTEKVKLKVIKLISEDEWKKHITNLFNAQVSYSAVQQAAIETVFELYDSETILKLLPSELKVKENMAYLACRLDKSSMTIPLSWTKTATDVLRVASALSGGDVSLSENTKYKLNNKQRRFVVSRLDAIKYPQEDMLRHRAKWLRLGEYLHVASPKFDAPKAKAAFNDLRNNDKKIYTFNRAIAKELTASLDEGTFSTKLRELLSSRPGEFGRKLDYLLCNFNTRSVLADFKKVAGELATPMLLKLIKHFEFRSEAQEFRLFTPKSRNGKAYYREGENREILSASVCKQIKEVVEEVLVERFAEKAEKKKHVYIDSSLKKILVPLVMRDAKKALETVARGSRVAFDSSADTVRMFCYWHENAVTGRVDLDLSAGFLDADFNSIGHVSWTSLAEFGCTHSGDIQSAPNGASEFIDINIPKLLAKKVRYVVMSVYSFCGQNLETYECFAGVMERKSPKSGEAFEAKTVKNKFDLATDSTASIPLILDIETREVLWCDFSMASGRYATIESRTPEAKMKVKALAKMSETQPNLFDLLTLHAKAAGAKIHTSAEVLDNEKIKLDAIYDLDFAKNIVKINSELI